MIKNKNRAIERGGRGAFSDCLEIEKHSSWALFGDYNSSRVGLHLYKRKYGLRGYYENGRRNRTGALQSWKTWFTVKVDEKNGYSVVRCKVEYNPYLLIVFFLAIFSIMESIIRRAWETVFATIFGIVIMFVFVNDAFNEEEYVFQEVRQRLGVLDSEEDKGEDV